MPKSEKQPKTGKKQPPSKRREVDVSDGPEVPATAEEVPPEQPGIEEEPCPPAAEPKSELDIAQEEICSLQQQMIQLQTDLAKEKERYLYLQAEFDNSEKRRQKALEGERKRMEARIVSAFLPLVDSFLPAVQKVDEGTYTDVVQLGEGLKSLKQQLDAILRGFNVVPIDEVNVPFDYNLHEVMMTQERDDVDDQTVLNIVHVGWKLGADVLRPAKVVVARKPAPPPIPEEITEDFEADTASGEEPAEIAPENNSENAGDAGEAPVKHKTKSKAPADSYFT
ncbi:MAG TPA: nucleotide exchange factor GrpE [Candidatus Lokiarchaeia archaeon]|nr:nucleotide exchange factor GrpE [Candidatus Lokiarchaeia archaeon]